MMISRMIFGLVVLALAASSGFLVSQALSAEPTPTRTVTVNVATGPAGPKGDVGPAGPKGDPGEAGSTNCPTGYAHGDLVINHPGGQVTIFTCLKD